VLRMAPDAACATDMLLVEAGIMGVFLPSEGPFAARLSRPENRGRALRKPASPVARPFATVPTAAAERSATALATCRAV
jgi:hypothetical protein